MFATSETLECSSLRDYLCGSFSDCFVYAKSEEFVGKRFDGKNRWWNWGVSTMALAVEGAHVSFGELSQQLWRLLGWPRVRCTEW